MRPDDTVLLADNDRSARRRWLALAVLAVAQFMVFLDETVVNIALPSIKTNLGFTQSTLAWVVSVYIVVFGGLVLAGIERRSPDPLVPAGFVHRRAALVPNVLQLLLGISGISTLFLLTLYTQQVLGYSPLRAGVAYLPLAAGVAAASAVASRLVGRTGSRPLAIAGLATAAVAMTVLGHASPAARYWTGVLPALVILGLGAGLSFVSITTAALERVDDSAAGLASGLLSMTVQIGGAVGVTVLAGVVATWRSGGLLAAGAAPLAAQAGGLRLAFLLAAAVSAAAALVAALALQRGTGTPGAAAARQVVA